MMEYFPTTLSVDVLNQVLMSSDGIMKLAIQVVVNLCFLGVSKNNCHFSGSSLAGLSLVKLEICALESSAVFNPTRAECGYWPLFG